MRIVLLLLASLSAAALADEPRLRIPFERYRLDNGLVVILHPDPRLPEVVVDLWFRVGSKDDPVHRTGLAHLFEHLMFMGTKNVPNGQFDAIMESEGGSNNASTSEDRTNYFEIGPAHLLETFLWLEADRLSSLPRAMTKDKVDLQRDVVKNERRQSYENRPYGRVELVLPEQMWPASHPYHHPVIGSHADLSAARVEEVKGFFERYYVPANASLVISGDFKPEEARRLVARYFGWMPRRPEPAYARPAPVHLEQARRVTVRDAVELAQVTLAWSSPAAGEAGDAECELLAAVLGAGESSRLERALVFDRRIAESVEVEQRANRYGGNFVIVATARPGHSAAELEQALSDELATLEKSPPSAAELERARAFVETKRLEEIGTLFGLADKLNEYELRYGDPGELERSLLERYRSATPGELAWQAHLFERPRSTVTVLPIREARR